MSFFYKIKLWLKVQPLSYNIINHIFTHRLLPHYTSQSLGSSDTPIVSKSIIYMADGLIRHGGICDRIWGMVSAYDYFYKQNGMNFKIYFVHPYQLTDYLIPNCYNWIMVSEPKRIKGYGTPAVVSDSLNPKNIAASFRKISKRNIVETHLYTNTHYAKHNFRNLFNELFKPSTFLQTQIDKQTCCIGEPFISITFRFRNAFGDFNEPDSIPLSKDIQDILIQKCLNQIDLIHKAYIKYNKVLLTCDSTTFINHAKSLDYIYVIPGDISHVDYNDDKKIALTQLKTFLDLFMLSKADSLFYVISKYMYHGSFAYTAAMIGDKPYKVISIDNI